MRLISALAAVIVLFGAAPAALAQTTIQTDQPISDPAAVAAQAELEAAGGALGPVFEALEPQAAAIRADTTLSDADKQTRIMALIAPHQAVIDRFSAALTVFVTAQAKAEGASDEDAAAAAQMAQGMLAQALVQALVMGEDADEEAAPSGEGT